MTIEYPFQAKLDDETRDTALFDKLFAGCQLENIAGLKSERTTGTDYLLCTPNGWVRLENKFEQHATGNVALEIVSYRLVPGWFWTSQTAWLLSFFRSGEVVIVPMEQLRRVLARNPLRAGLTTTAYNPSRGGSSAYLSWCVLERIAFLLQRVDGAMFVDLHEDCEGVPRAKPAMLGSFQRYRVSRGEMLERMAQGPLFTRPLRAPDLSTWLQPMWERNLRKTHPVHQREYERLREQLAMKAAPVLSL